MRYTHSQRLEHIARWESSGLSKAAYCREHTVAYQTFYSWTRVAVQRDGAAPVDDFVQLRDDRAQVHGVGLRVEVGVHRLAFALGADPAWIAGVLDRLARC